MISRSKWTALAALVALVATLPVVLFFSYWIAREKESDFTERSELMARNFADQVWFQLKDITEETSSPSLPTEIQEIMNSMVTNFVVIDPIIYAQVVWKGALVAQHHHLGDMPVDTVLKTSGTARAREVTRQRLENGIEYLDLRRGIEPGRAEEPVDSYVRLGISLALLHAAVNAERWLAALWGLGFVLGLSSVAYIFWPLWARLTPKLAPASSLAEKTVEFKAAANDQIRLGQLVIDDQAKEIRLNGSTLSMTPREYALILLLASEPGKVFSAQEIIERAWGAEEFISTEDVKKYIYLLRQKIERDPHNPQVILTVRGFGYKLLPPNAAVG